METKLSGFGRAALAVGSAVVALANPARADMVAVAGDLTGGPALRALRKRVMKTASGREMVEALAPARFPTGGTEALVAMRELGDGTLGREYARFMDSRSFVPEDRPAVRFVDDPRDAWVLQRYRDVHDLWHVLTEMPTSVLGELGQKWFEAAHTGLPVAVLSAVVGPARLSSEQRMVLFRDVVPWAVSCGRNANDLLAIRYEERLTCNVEDLRREWKITLPTLRSPHILYPKRKADAREE